jgi:hypothetical protein
MWRVQPDRPGQVGWRRGKDIQEEQDGNTDDAEHEDFA